MQLFVIVFVRLGFMFSKLVKLAFKFQEQIIIIISLQNHMLNELFITQTGPCNVRRFFTTVK